jgi:hypothetical protein
MFGEIWSAERREWGFGRARENESEMRSVLK